MFDQLEVSAEGAPTTVSSGVIELERRSFGPVESLLHGLLKGVPPLSPGERPKFDSDFKQKLKELADCDDPTLITTLVTLRRLEDVPLTHEIQRAIAQGVIETRGDYHAVSSLLLADRSIDNALANQPVLDQIQLLGGTVEFECESGPCLSVIGTADELLAIAGLSEVLRIDRDEPPSENENLDGLMIDDLFQTRQFREYTYVESGGAYHFDGEVGVRTDLRFAVMENGTPLLTHPAFNENSGSASRIEGYFECVDAFCLPGLLSPNSSHATASLGAVMADITDGQHSMFVFPTDRLRRSSPAGESKGYVYRQLTGSSSHPAAWTHQTKQTPKPAVVAYSINPQNGDSTCTGATSLSESANTLLYENGVLLVASAGNEGGSSTNCTVEDPGSALGVFTVGGYGTNNQAQYPSLCGARMQL